MYILTYRDFVDIYSFQSLMEACNKNMATIFDDKQSLKNGIISSCPVTERSMRAYKLSGELIDINFDSLVPFKEFDHLIVEKNIIFNENCMDPIHSLYGKQFWFLKEVINFFVDENNRNKVLTSLFFKEPIDEFLEEAGYDFSSSCNGSYFIITDLHDDVCDMLLYIKLNDLESKCFLRSKSRSYSFKNYKIDCTTIDL